MHRHILKALSFTLQPSLMPHAPSRTLLTHERTLKEWSINLYPSRVCHAPSLTFWVHECSTKARSLHYSNFRSVSCTLLLSLERTMHLGSPKPPTTSFICVPCALPSLSPSFEHMTMSQSLPSSVLHPFKVCPCALKLLLILLSTPKRYEWKIFMKHDRIWDFQANG